MYRVFAATLTLFALSAFALASGAVAEGNPDIAALQVGLRGRGLYAGTVDGVLGPGTEAALRRFQRSKGLAANGVPGPRTRKALGRYGRRAPLGRRQLSIGERGWDVAALQFALAWQGFPSGNFDGFLSSHTDSALRRFQRRAGIRPDGVAGPATVAALRGPVPRCRLRLARPLIAPVGDVFGPRGNRFHAGVDFPAQTGTPVGAALAGTVVFAGPGGSGWGNLVEIKHGNGVRTRYAHLSRIDVRLGARVAGGSTVGLVGSTGESTGPHLHFEVLVRGANVDPLAVF
ncbi:MAG: peptidoglycan DD-metalloendopeptidase family protein [Actinomycetota bacterium]